MVMFVKGQSELLTTFMYIGLAVVVGVAMLSYFSSVLAGYRSQLDLLNNLQIESVNIFVSEISYDDRASTLWLLFKRIDGSLSDFFVAVDVGTSYLPCSSISFYNPRGDSDGVICNDVGRDCIYSSSIYSGSMERVYVPWEGSIVDFRSYARSMGFTLSDTIHICRIENVCRYISTQGLCRDSTIARIQLPETSIARIFIVTLYGGTPYIVGVHEVALG
ncbi:MAG: hypothetical protein QXI86_01480 [Ignisphaera sp.]